MSNFAVEWERFSKRLPEAVQCERCARYWDRLAPADAQSYFKHCKACSKTHVQPIPFSELINE